MELANGELFSTSVLPAAIRVAHSADAGSIARLLETAVYRHVHADWYLPGDWLGSPGFVVLPKPATSLSTARLIGVQQEIMACLAAGADVPPVAWLRAAAVSRAALEKADKPGDILAAMMARIEAHCRRRGLTTLAWLMAETWPRTWLEEMEFRVGNEIETYLKQDMAIPPLPTIPHLTIRPVIESDFDTLAELEASAFDPLWRHSAHALRLAFDRALSYDLVLLAGTAVGFQLSTRSDAGAHLVRLTVHKGHQGQGIGSALLAHALRGYYQDGLRAVSLNTQTDNLSSQLLYRKFGFRASGHRLPVWIKELPRDTV